MSTLTHWNLKLHPKVLDFALGSRCLAQRLIHDPCYISWTFCFAVIRIPYWSAPRIQACYYWFIACTGLIPHDNAVVWLCWLTTSGWLFIELLCLSCEFDRQIPCARVAAVPVLRQHGLWKRKFETEFEVILSWVPVYLWLFLIPKKSLATYPNSSGEGHALCIQRFSSGSLSSCRNCCTVT